MKRIHGFTLIELMIVTSIIGILASVSLPQYQTYVHRSEMVEAISMAGTLREDVTAYYMENIEFPTNNVATGIPESQFLIGNRITGVTVEEGAIHVSLGNKVAQPLQGKTLSFRPAVVIGSPKSPIAWLCGYDSPVTGMEVRGVNKTDVPNEFLPSACRSQS